MEASNTKEMREVLENLRYEAMSNYDLHDYLIAGAPGERKVGHCVSAETIIDEINSVLSKPPRNCDVGTAEEQKWRFLAVCKDKKHYDNVRECPLFVGPNCYYVDCFARWSQLPYEVVQGGDSNGSK